MARAGVEIVREYFETTNVGDFDGAMAYYADDVELVVPAEAFLEGGKFEGREAVGMWFGNWFRAFQRGYQFELEELSEVGNAVLAAARHRGRGKASGAEVVATTGYLFQVRDGLITKLELFGSREEAFAAAGHPE